VDWLAPSGAKGDEDCADFVICNQYHAYQIVNFQATTNFVLFNSLSSNDFTLVPKLEARWDYLYAGDNTANPPQTCEGCNLQNCVEDVSLFSEWNSVDIS